MNKARLEAIVELTQGLNPSPDRYKQRPDNAVNQAVEDAAREVATWMWSDEGRAATGKTALDREAYQELLGLEPPEPSNVSRLIPHRQDEATVQEEVRRIATRLAVKLVQTEEIDAGDPLTVDKISDSIRVLLNVQLRKRLEAIGDQENFHLGGNIWRSEKNLKQSYKTVRRAINRGEISLREAEVFGLFNMGAITINDIQKRSGLKPGKQKGSREFSDYEHSELIQEIEESLKWSRQYVEKMITELQRKCRRAMRDGTVSDKRNGAPLPDTNSHLRTFSVYRLMEYLFETGSNHRDYNDAQMLLNFFLVHWTFQRFTESFEPGLLRKIDVNLTGGKRGGTERKGLFEVDENQEEVLLEGREPILKFENNEFTLTERFVRQDLKLVKVDDEEYPMYFEEMGEKTDDSSVEKLFKNGDKRRVEDIPDLKRTRLVAWTVTQDQMLNDTKVREHMEKICRIAANKLGLTEDPACKDIRGLRKGKFIIEKPEPNDPFPKFGIQARLKNGAPFELQIIPFDLHCFEATEGSGIDHDKYKAKLFRKIARRAIPRSVSPLTHEVLDAEETSDKQLFEATQQALKKTGIQQAMTEFMARSGFTQKKAA